MIEPPSHRLEAARRIAARLQAAKSIAVATHVNGDGDGWGSACALFYHFQPLGADVRLLAATPYPDRLRFVLRQGIETLAPDAKGLQALRSADVQVVVDASEPGRLGEFADAFAPDRTVIIDHHAVASSQLEAADVLIDPGAAASAELVYDVLHQTAAPISVETARALYVGLVTDTGSFRYSNATPHAHRLAAQLIEAGVDPQAIYPHLFGTLTARELGVLEAALARLRRDTEFGITWSALDADVEALEEYDLVIDHLRNAQGTRVAILFRDIGGSVKISFRSNGVADVAELARSFGGGGHRKAAGATVEGPLAEVVEQVLAASRVAVSLSPDT